MDEIYLCRHGETSWTRTGQHTGSTDIPLTNTGREQALLLGKALKAFHFTKVYSSPLIRSAETCKLAGFHPILEKDAVEWNYGIYEGLDHNEIMKARDSWDLFSDGAPDGESPEDVGKRADRIIDKFLHVPGNVLLFSHGHFLRVFASRWLQLPPKDGKLFTLSVASLSILGFERKNHVMKRWNDTSYL